MKVLVQFNRKKVNFIVFTIYLLVFCGLYGVITLHESSVKNTVAQSRVWGWLGWIILSWALYSWYRLQGSLSNLYVAFYLTGFVFMYGQSLLFALGVEHEASFLGYVVSFNSILHAQVFTCISMLLMHIGGLVGTRPINGKQVISEKVLLPNKYRAVRIVGWLLLFVSVLPFMYEAIVNTEIVARYGYRALYGYDGSITSPLLTMGRLGIILIRFGQYFLPAIICLFIGYRDSKLAHNSIMILSLFIVLYYLYIGSRSPAVVFAICMVFLFDVLIRPFKGLRVVLSTVAIYLGVSVLAIIADLRGAAGRTLASMFDAIVANIGSENYVVAFISEIGYSMFPLVKVTQFVSSYYPFRYGSSYLYAFTSIVPNLGFWEVHPAGQHAQLGDWLMDVLHMSSGPGFSATAEAFINFGWLGIFVFLVYGYAYARIFGRVGRKNAAFEPELLAAIVILFSKTVMTHRNAFIATVRAVFYFALPLYLLMRSIASQLHQSSRSSEVSQRHTEAPFSPIHLSAES